MANLITNPPPSQKTQANNTGLGPRQVLTAAENAQAQLTQHLVHHDPDAPFSGSLGEDEEQFANMTREFLRLRTANQESDTTKDDRLLQDLVIKHIQNDPMREPPPQKSLTTREVRLYLWPQERQIYWLLPAEAQVTITSTIYNTRDLAHKVHAPFARIDFLNASRRIIRILSDHSCMLQAWRSRAVLLSYSCIHDFMMPFCCNKMLGLASDGG